jgi:CO/xanthine dehydrogenase FAD-binding subunit
MKPFDYIAPGTLPEALALLARNGSDAAILAGGTDLLVEFRRPDRNGKPVVLDISRIGALGGIAEERGAIIVRPLTTHAHLEHSALVRSAAPLLAQAAGAIGSPQIRNRGTVGGNIMNAATCADTVPPLLALDAVVTLSSSAAVRQLRLGELFVEPYRTAAAPDEILTEIRFPALPADARSAFLKLGRRNALSISRLSVAAVLRIGRDGRIAEARIVPGAAFPTWQRITEAEALLLGEKPSPRIFTAAGARASHEMIRQTGRRWSTEYKEPILAVLVRRALEACAAMHPLENEP